MPVMQKYAEQYYHLERNFPRFLSQMHTNCDDPAVRQTITENLYDEEHGESNHRELWLRFSESIGADRQAVETSEPLPETKAAIECFKDLAHASLLSGSAALAAYESQIPAVSESKLEGLKNHYQITDSRGTAFFRVHSTLDIEHSNAWWNIIEAEATEPSLCTRAEVATVAARDALWNFLTGICRTYFPEALEGC